MALFVAVSEGCANAYVMPMCKNVELTITGLDCSLIENSYMTNQTKKIIKGKECN